MAREPLTHAIQEDDESEYGYGAGMFPPGIANNEGQRYKQDDFGAPYGTQGLSADGGTNADNYARAVADRRTDPLDAESNRDFDVAGLEDRYGANPPLVRAKRQPNVVKRQEITPDVSKRRW